MSRRTLEDNRVTEEQIATAQNTDPASDPEDAATRVDRAQAESSFPAESSNV
jgi:hypothetical protein